MREILIVPYEDKYQEDVKKICYRTGYMGEDLTGKDIFNDRELFCHLFVNYYIHYEKEHCFVAMDPEIGRAIGYVIGTLDTKKQEARFAMKIVPQIFLHILTVTWLQYPESFQALWIFIKSIHPKIHMGDIYKKYPSHLHINILEEYQNIGLGSRLMGHFEDHMRLLGSPGIHLRTTSANLKAVPFYQKKGYVLLGKRDVILWKQKGSVNELIFGKKLGEDALD